MGIRNDVPDGYVSGGTIENPFSDAELEYLFNPQPQEVKHTINGVEDTVDADKPLADLLAEMQVFIDSLNALANSLQPSIERISDCVADINKRLK